MKQIVLTLLFGLSAIACGSNSGPTKPPVIEKPDPIKVESVEVQQDLTLNLGEIQKLTATILPANASEKRVWWTSSDIRVAKIDTDGNVTGLTPGTAVITVTTYDGEHEATCAVTTVDPDQGKEYALIWADEFDYEGEPDSSAWSREIWNPGQVNHELQYYTGSQKNAIVNGGTLKINLIKEDDGRITSARLITADKRSFTYGRFEIRAKLPRGKGTWPAIWMLGENINHGVGWPTCGEIDIMEHVGYNQGQVHASVHTRDRNHTINTQATAITQVPDCSEEFHVYELEWTRLEISMLVDGKKYFTYRPTAYDLGNWPFNKPEFLLLNIAWGGDWGAAGGGVDESVLPQTMEVDYVRVYQKQ